MMLRFPVVGPMTAWLLPQQQYCAQANTPAAPLSWSTAGGKYRRVLHAMVGVRDTITLLRSIGGFDLQVVITPRLP